MVAGELGESQETSRDDFEKALQNLAQIAVVGLTDYYGVSLCLLMYRLGRRKDFVEGCTCDIELLHRVNVGTEKKKNRADPGEMLFEYGTFAEVRRGPLTTNKCTYRKSTFPTTVCASHHAPVCFYINFTCQIVVSPSRTSKILPS
jgi:hypothetical protein